MTSICNFYDDLSCDYHLMFENWDTTIIDEGKTIASLLGSSCSSYKILDCSCGIGTQLIALKELGYHVEGSDISRNEVMRALQEAKRRNLKIDIRVDDMRFLNTSPVSHYNVIMTLGNSLPHLLNDKAIFESLTTIRKKLKTNGFILIGVRDYEPILANHFSSLEPIFLEDKYGKRIVHQVWDWQDERMYRVHVYITQQKESAWVVKHFVGMYRAITLQEIKNLMQKAGFKDISTLTPESTGFSQPIIKGYK